MIVRPHRWLQGVKLSVTPRGRVAIAVVALIGVTAAASITLLQRDLYSTSGHDALGGGVVRLEMPVAEPPLPEMSEASAVAEARVVPSTVPMEAAREVSVLPPKQSEVADIASLPPASSFKEPQAKQKSAKAVAKIAQIEGGANFRSGASITQKRLGLLESGEPLTIRSKEGRWYAVELEDGRKGYVHSRLVTKPAKP